MVKEKITLKQLAPYLPYKLKILHYGKSKVMTTGGSSSNNWIGIKAVLNGAKGMQPDKYIPILHPLSDLIEEITVNKETFVPIRVINEIHSIEYHEEENKFSDDALQGVVNDCDIDLGFSYPIEFLPYIVIQKLFEFHFDVFGLIEKGLAININTLK